MAGLKPNDFYWVIEGKLAVSECIGGGGLTSRKIRRSLPRVIPMPLEPGRDVGGEKKLDIFDTNGCIQTVVIECIHFCFFAYFLFIYYLFN